MLRINKELKNLYSSLEIYHSLLSITDQCGYIFKLLINANRGTCNKNSKHETDLFSIIGPQNGWNDPPALTRVPKKKVGFINQSLEWHILELRHIYITLLLLFDGQFEEVNWFICSYWNCWMRNAVLWSVYTWFCLNNVNILPVVVPLDKGTIIWNIEWKLKKHNASWKLRQF